MMLKKEEVLNIRIKDTNTPTVVDMLNSRNYKNNKKQDDVKKVNQDYTDDNTYEHLSYEDDTYEHLSYEDDTYEYLNFT